MLGETLCLGTKEIDTVKSTRGKYNGRSDIGGTPVPFLLKNCMNDYFLLDYQAKIVYNVNRLSAKKYVVFIIIPEVVMYEF